MLSSARWRRSSCASVSSVCQATVCLCRSRGARAPRRSGSCRSPSGRRHEHLRAVDPLQGLERALGGLGGSPSGLAPRRRTFCRTAARRRFGASGSWPGRGRRLPRRARRAGLRRVPSAALVALAITSGAALRTYGSRSRLSSRSSSSGSGGGAGGLTVIASPLTCGADRYVGGDPLGAVANRHSSEASSRAWRGLIVTLTGTRSVSVISTVTLCSRAASRKQRHPVGIGGQAGDLLAVLRVDPHRPNPSHARVDCCSEASSEARGQLDHGRRCWWARMLARSPSAKRP